MIATNIRPKGIGLEKQQTIARYNAFNASKRQGYVEGL